MINWLIQRAKKTNSPIQFLLVLIPAGAIFLAALPMGFVFGGRALDQLLRLPAIAYQPINWLVGGFLIAVGLPFAIWTIVVQIDIGHGTPVPIIATQKLIVQPPYTLCRNPMALGTILAYLGLAIGFGSIGAIALVALFASLLLIYVINIEEKELEARFGQAYTAYRSQTPFLIPRLSRHNHSIEEHS